MPHPTRSRTALAVAAAVSIALVLSACAGATGEPGTTGAGEASPATLAFGVQAPPNSFDPAQLHDGQQRYVWGAVYDTLILSDTTGELQPNAAESWEYSDDAKTLTLTLREGMTYSNGEPVTAQDVATILDRTRTTAGPQQTNLAAVDSIEAPDERTVVLNLSEADPNLLVALSYGAGVVAEPEAFESEAGALDPVGSGPYTLDRDRTVDGSTYVLERRDDYWNADAFPFETITVRAIQDRTALFNALMSGELDAGTVDATQRAQAESAGLELTSVEGVSVGAIIIADRAGEVSEPLADVRVRQAINYALDREGMIEGILGGAGAPASQLFNRSSPAFVEDLDGRYEFNPDEARRLLAEAGYEDGFTLTMPANLPVTNFQPTIAQSLADVGITVEWEPVPAQQSGQTTRWGMYFNFGSAAAPSRTAALYLQPTGSQNPFRYQDETIDALLAEAQQETDPERANELYREMNEYVVEQAWYAPMFLQATTWATSDGIAYVGDSDSLPDIRVFGTR